MQLLLQARVGHERGAIVFRARARESANEAQIRTFPSSPNCADVGVRHQLAGCTFGRVLQHARYDGDPDKK